LFFQHHLVMPCVWWDIPSSMVLTWLWSVGNCVTSSQCIWTHIVFCPCCVFNTLPLLHNPCCCSLPSPSCMLHLLICTYLNSLAIACPASYVSLCAALVVFKYCSLCILYHFIILSLSFAFVFWSVITVAFQNSFKNQDWESIKFHFCIDLMTILVAYQPNCPLHFTTKLGPWL